MNNYPEKVIFVGDELYIIRNGKLEKVSREDKKKKIKLANPTFLWR